MYCSQSSPDPKFVCFTRKQAFVTLECRIFSLLSLPEASMNPALIFAELGEREVQAISFYLCTRKYWQSSPDSKFFCLKRKHHFVTLECQIFNFLRLRLLWIQLNFCRIGWERGASDLNLLVFVFRIQALSTCLWGHTDSLSLSFYCNFVRLRGDRWASDLIFLWVSDFTTIPAAVNLTFPSILLM